MNRIYKLVLVVEVSARSSSVLSISVRINVVTDINIFVQALSLRPLPPLQSQSPHARPPMTSLPCMVCGTVAPPRLEPGTGPHGAKALCAGCGRFLRWLPKVLLNQEVCMQASINRCTLLGTI